MERTYKLYEDLPMANRAMFEELIDIEKKLFRKEEELYALELEKKSIAQKLIVYLQQKHYNGIQKDNILAYLQAFSRGAPSFWQVINKVISKLCNQDKTRLLKTYEALSKEKGTTVKLVVKI